MSLENGTFYFSVLLLSPTLAILGHGYMHSRKAAKYWWTSNIGGTSTLDRGHEVTGTFHGHRL
jgi:hypothetical protein